MIKEIEIQGCITVPEEVSDSLRKMSGVLAVDTRQLSMDTI